MTVDKQIIFDFQGNIEDFSSTPEKPRATRMTVDKVPKSDGYIEFTNCVFQF